MKKEAKTFGCLLGVALWTCLSSPGAAASDSEALCSGADRYPEHAGFAPDPELTSVKGARSGTPLIEQFRNNRRIARYTSFADKAGCSYAGDGTDHVTPGRAAATGCGPFTRVHAWRMWEPGDTFLVYPAVYRGPENNPFIGPAYDDGPGFEARITHAPDHVRIIGVVKNGVRPVILLDGGASENTLSQGAVYLDASEGLTIENLEIDAGPGAAGGRAAVYDVAASDLTLRNVRISGFASAGLNGLFGAGQYRGTMLLDHVELDHDGGTNGPAHNAYINASAVDPNFTVRMIHSWTHDAFYGHLFKSRAQNNIFEDDLFEGGTPQQGFSQAEAYLLDIPNGGRLTAKNNVFIKTASGPNSNGISLAFGEEGLGDDRPQSVDIENNRFIALARRWDGSHPIFPFLFMTSHLPPGGAGWDHVQATISHNIFTGYCTGHDAMQDYRGEAAATEGFAAQK